MAYSIIGAIKGGWEASYRRKHLSRDLKDDWVLAGERKRRGGHSREKK